MHTDHCHSSQDGLILIVDDDPGISETLRGDEDEGFALMLWTPVRRCLAAVTARYGCILWMVWCRHRRVETLRQLREADRKGGYHLRTWKTSNCSEGDKPAL